MTEFEFNKRFGERLEERMHERGLKQEEFARELGISQATLSRYILGKQTPSAITGIKIAKRFGCSINDLIGPITELIE